ncbi:dihydrofolate reductase family protein [Nocardioides sp. KIGAM211]|uniref:Dihydrofolate reductase family protein n=1 Tax=Nocardioides luti TaxID=2761101 RepID=A0A7X0RHT9_9ACTN|nr:dihydrofolate reductase family protein [Nocardioides luti]MBB6628551.1 dihydrofolate reductase family protein [Nocardioides luti]
MRLLVGPEGLDAGRELDDDDLRRVYAAPSQPWLRVNMVSTLDGSATGSSGLSGSINNDADHRVFHTLRAMADAILVGAGTARAEGYRPGDTPIVLVSRRGEVPEKLRGGPPGSVLMATVARAEHLDEAREALGEEHVVVAGTHRVDLAAVRAELVERGWRELLCEGGPHLLRDLLDQGVADELTTTIVPRAVGGTHPRITDGAPVDVPLRLHALVEEDGTLLGRWLV